MRRHHLFVASMWLAIAFISIVSILIIVWLILPYPVTTIQQPIRILNENKEVRIGEEIIQELKINKPNDSVPENPTRVLLCSDGNLVTLAALPSILNLPVGKYTLVNDRYILPPKVAVGSDCVFVWRQSYRVNPIRLIPVEWRSESFKVKGAN